MRRLAALAGIVLSAPSVSADAQDGAARAAVHAGLSLCRGWVDRVVAKTITKPTFDADAFSANMVGGVRLDRIATVPDAIILAGLKRFITDFWHLDAGTSGGVFVASSRFVPRCEVVGGGSIDFQPLVRAELADPAFTGDWTRIDHKEEPAAGMASDHYRLAKQRREELLVSSAISPGGRTDRPQLIATLMHQLR